MSDTLGSLIDKIITVDMKLWSAQDRLYRIRNMDFEQFRKEFSTEDGLLELFNYYKNAVDLNLQRNDLIDEIDSKIIEVVDAIIKGESLDKFIQRKHKIYA